MKKKPKDEPISRPLPEAKTDEAKAFKQMVEQVLSVPKVEIDRREAEERSAKSKGGSKSPEQNS